MGSPGPFTAEVVINPDFTVADIDRRLFGSFVEHLGPLRLHRHLRARPPHGRRRRVPPGRHRPGQGARRLDDPLPRRQLRLRLPLGGRRRPGRGPAPPPRPRLALHRDQRGRPPRVRQLVGKVGSELMYARQPRHPRRPRGPRRPRVRQPPRRHDVVGPAASPTARSEPSASACGAWATRWTDRGSSATAPPRTTRARRRDRAGDALGSTPSVELVVCGSSSSSMPTFGELGAHGPRADLRRRRLHLLPCLLRGARTATSTASSPPPSTWTASSTRSWRRRTTSRRCCAATRRMYISFDEWNVAYLERLVQGEQDHDIERGPSLPASSRTSTTSPTPWSSAA